MLWIWIGILALIIDAYFIIHILIERKTPTDSEFSPELLFDADLRDATKEVEEYLSGKGLSKTVCKALEKKEIQ